MSVLLDTHVWIWWLTGQESLSALDREALDELAEHGSLSVSAISLWEAQMLHSRGRLHLDRGFEAWLIEAAAADVVRVVPLDVSIILALERIPSSFHGDPADRIIVATARAHDLPLATRDRRIRRSRLVRLWKR